MTIEILGRAMLLFLSVVTLVIATYAGYETFQYAGPEISVGGRIRKYFFGCLTVATFIRFVCILLELTYIDDQVCKISLIYCLLIRDGADVLFISIYSILILHWMALLSSTRRSPFAMVRLFFIVFNVLLFGSICSIFMISSSTSLASNFWFGLSCAFLIILLCMISVGVLIARSIPFSLVLGQSILYRLITLSVICTISILMATTYYFSISYQLIIW